MRGVSMKIGYSAGRGKTLEGMKPKRATCCRRSKPLTLVTDSRVEQGLESEDCFVGFTL
jgi:hypothetical protein